MKILVKYSLDSQEVKTIAVEIDEKTPLTEVAKKVAEAVGNNDIVLLPVKVIEIDTKNPLSLKEYCQKFPSAASIECHFAALDRNSLTQIEQAILTMLDLELAPSGGNSKKNKGNNNLQNAQALIRSLCRILPADMQEALVVRLTDKTNMFGETYKDTISPETIRGLLRWSVQVHPYPWLASGASNVIINQNIFNELSVALVYNQRRDRRPQTDTLRQAGIPDFLKLPEGYMHPKPCKGGEKGISLVPSDIMDEAEELMLKNMPMREAYSTINDKYPTHESHQSATYDNSTKECAVRESYEEVGFKVQIQDVQFVSQREENRLIPSIANVYLIKTKQKDITPPALKVDGIEIKEGMWGKLKAFRFVKDESKPEKIRVTLDYYDKKKGDCYAIEIPSKYALMIGQAVRKFRDEEIQNNSQIEGYPLFAARENVEARVKQILSNGRLNPNKRTLQDILGAPPESVLQALGVTNLPGDTSKEKEDNLKALANLGKDADSYYKKIAVLAQAFKRTSLDKSLDAEQLMELATEGPAIEANLYQSKSRLFPLARLHHASSISSEEYDTSPIPHM